MSSFDYGNLAIRQRIFRPAVAASALEEMENFRFATGRLKIDWTELRGSDNAMGIELAHVAERSRYARPSGCASRTCLGCHGGFLALQRT